MSTRGLATGVALMKPVSAFEVEEEEPPPEVAPVRRLDQAQPLVEEENSYSLLVEEADDDSIPISHPSRPSRKDLLHLINTPPLRPLHVKHLHSLRKAIVSAKRRDDVVVVAAFLRLAITSRRWSHAQYGIQLLSDFTPWILRRHGGSVSKAFVHLYEMVCKLFTENEDWDFLYSVSGQAIECGVISQSILVARGRACYETQKYAEGLEAFQLFRKHGLKPPGRACDDAVGSYLFCHDFVKAHETLAEKEAQGHRTTVQTILTLLDGMFLYGGNKKMEDGILENADRIGRLHNAPRQDVKVLNRIMSVRAARGDLVAALDTLAYFDLTKLPAPLRLPSDQYPTRRVESKCPQPNIATFATLMGVSIRAKRIDCAIALFRQSQELSLGLNEYLISALLKALMINNQHDNAVNLVLKLSSGTAILPIPNSTSPLLRLDAFKPTALVFDTLLAGILDFRGLPGAVEVLHHVVADPILFRSDKISQGMIDALLRYLLKKASASATLASLRQENSRAVEKVQAITKGGTKRVDVRTVSGLIRLVWKWERAQSGRANFFKLLRRGSKPDPASTATSLWQKIEATSSARLPLTFHPFLGLIRSSADQGDFDAAHQVIFQAHERGVDPHPAMYSVFIGACMRRSRFDLAKRAYAEMQEAGVVADEELYRTLAIACSRARDLKGVTNFWEQAMKQFPDTVTMLDSTFVLAYYRALVGRGDIRKAQEYLKGKLGEGLVSTKGMLRLLIRTKKLVRRKVNRIKRNGQGTSAVQVRSPLRGLLRAVEVNRSRVRSRLAFEARQVELSPLVKERVRSTLAKRRALRLAAR